MASPYGHLFFSAFIFTLGLLLMSTATASATSLPSPPPADYILPSDKYLPSADQSSLAAGIFEQNSTLNCTIPEIHSDQNATNLEEEDKSTASCSGQCYKLKVAVAWAVGSCCMGLFVLGAWLMRRSIKNAAKVGAFENHNLDHNEIEK